MVKLLSEVELSTGSKGYSFEVVSNPQEDRDTYLKGLEIEESLKRAEQESEES